MTSTIGFPTELSNQLDYSLPEGMKAYSVKVVPSNLSQSQTATQTLTASQASLTLNGASQNIIFDIPAGQSKDTFIDPPLHNSRFQSKLRNCKHAKCSNCYNCATSFSLYVTLFTNFYAIAIRCYS